MTFEQLADLYEKGHLQPAKYVGGKKVSGLRSMHTAKYALPIFEEELRAIYRKSSPLLRAAATDE